MNTMIADSARRAGTASTPTTPSWLAQALAAFSRRRKPLDSAADLLARADAYESTQPSYAADLRAAVARMTGGI